MLHVAPEDLLARADIPPPAAMQRRAGALLDQAIGLLQPTRTAMPDLPLTAHPLQLVRAELLWRAGRSLGALALARAALEESGGQPVQLEGFVTPEMRRVARLLSGQILVPGSPTDSQVGHLRVRAHRSREFARELTIRPPRPGAVGGRTVLAAAQQPGHVQDVAPLAPLLDDRGFNLLVLATDQRTTESARSAGIPVQPLAPPASDVVRAAVAARRWRRAIRHRLRDRSWLVDAADPLEGAVFAQAADEVVDALLRRLFAMSSPVSAALSAASAVVLPNPYAEFGRLVGEIARAANVPTIGLQHGTAFQDDPRWRHLPVDRVCVWGEPSAQALRSSGVPDLTIVSTGSPKFDRFFAESGDARAEARGGGASVLVATSGPGDRTSLEQHLLFIRELGHAVDARADLNWTVKLHPKDRREYYDALNDRVRLVEADRSRESIFDLLEPADVLVTVTSMTAVDAVAAGVPVVLFNTRGSTDSRDEPFLAEAAEGVASTGAELADLCVHAAARRPSIETPSYLSRHFAHEGQSADAIVDQVEQRARLGTGIRR